MKNLSKDIRVNVPWILLLVGVFFILSIKFVTYGMYLDGLIYNKIALNLAHNLGSLWDPFLSYTIWPHFHEHPALSFYFQSWFFRIFGDSIFVDKFYCFFIMLLNLGIFLLFWKQANKQVKWYLYWIPVFCFLVVDKQVNCGGVIELTLSVFTGLASYFIVRGCVRRKYKIAYLLLSSALISSAFFINGLQAFFPIIIPTLYGFVFTKDRFLQSVADTLILSLISFSIIIIVFLISRPAFENVYFYFQEQLIPTVITGTRQDSGYRPGLLGHLYGLTRIWPLLWQLIVITIISSIIYLRQKKQNIFLFMKIKLKDHWTAFFLLLGLSAFVPVLLSPRQHTHYFIPSLPFFSLAVAQILTPLYTSWVQLIDIYSNRYKTICKITGMFSILAVFLFGFSVGNGPFFIKKDTYRKSSLNDALVLSKIIPRYTEICAEPPPFEVKDNIASYYMGQYSYFSRYAYLMVENCGALIKDFYIQPKRKTNDTPLGYERINMEFQQIVLFKKKQ